MFIVFFKKSVLVLMQDIDDRPPNPNQQISDSRMAPRAKVFSQIYLFLKY